MEAHVSGTTGGPTAVFGTHQAAVHGEDLFVDDGSDRQAVEAVRKRLPKLDVIPPLACLHEM